MSDTRSRARGSASQHGSWDSATPTRWVGLIVFAAFLMWLLGFFQAIAGFAAIVNDDYYKTAPDRLLLVNSYTTWGWIHLILGVAIFAASGQHTCMVKTKQDQDQAKAAKDDHPGAEDGHPCFKKSSKDDESTLREESCDVKETALPASIS